MKNIINLHIAIFKFITNFAAADRLAEARSVEGKRWAAVIAERFAMQRHFLKRLPDALYWLVAIFLVREIVEK